MKQHFLHFRHYLLQQSRRTLIVMAISMCLILFGSWQLAYGILGRIQTDASELAEAPKRGDYQPDNTVQSDKTNNAPTDPNTKDDENKEGSKKDNASTPDTSLKSLTNGGSAEVSKPSGSPPKNNPSTPDPNPSTIISLRSIVPQYENVLTLNGLNYNITNYVPKTFGGLFSRAPYTLSKVDYPASLASNSISTGVINLNKALRSTPGQKIVLAHSQGAQVASHWMRQYANDPTAPSANELTFILTGNPLRSTGGYIIGRYEVGGTIGQPTPTTTKWPIIDVARRYDGWADWVRDSSNQWAVDNANAGRTTFHSRYDVTDLYASTNTIWKSGNTTYVLTKEDTLPLWKDNSSYPLSVRTAMRAQIERAYNRPANDPKVQLIPVESAEWQNQLREWGVPF